MISIPSSPPQDTFGDVLAGQAFREGTNDFIKSSAGQSINLATGQVVSHAAGTSVVIAAGAVYELFPSA